MNKRLRKKKHVGEFKELGFDLLGELRPGTSDDVVDAFVGRLVRAVEARKLGFGGGGRDGKFVGFVTRMGRGSASEDDRTALGAFLAGEGDIVRHEVGVLRDAWYGGD